jgi:hypothetical protein
MNIVTTELSKNPNLATPEPPPTAQAAPAGSDQPPPTPGAAPAEPDKREKSAPSKEKEHGATGKSETGGTQGDAKGTVKIDAPKGAPVVKAGAPAPHE